MNVAPGPVSNPRETPFCMAVRIRLGPSSA